MTYMGAIISILLVTRHSKAQQTFVLLFFYTLQKIFVHVLVLIIQQLQSNYQSYHTFIVTFRGAPTHTGERNRFSFAHFGVIYDSLFKFNQTLRLILHLVRSL